MLKKKKNSTYWKSHLLAQTHMEKYKHFIRMSVEEHFQYIDSTFWTVENILKRPSTAAIRTRDFRGLLIRCSNTKQAKSIPRTDYSLGCHHSVV